MMMDKRMKDSSPRGVGNEGRGRGGLNTNEHVREAEKYVAGKVDGVNVETGWSKKTYGTGENDKA